MHLVSKTESIASTKGTTYTYINKKTGALATKNDAFLGEGTSGKVYKVKELLENGEEKLFALKDFQNKNFDPKQACTEYVFFATRFWEEDNT